MECQQSRCAPSRVKECQKLNWSVPKIWQDEPVKSWKQSNIGCMPIFVQSLLMLPELVRPRVQLKQMFQEIVEEVMKSEYYEINKQRQKVEMLKANEREKEMNAHSVQEKMRTQTLNKETPNQNSDVFIYGSDAKRIEILVQDALKRTVLLSKEIETITINGRKFGEISSERFLSILSEEYALRNNPHRSVIILEEFTTSMFLNFKQSGFVNANRARGKRIGTICWSSRSQDVGIMREFSNRVYVPSSKEETERTSKIKTPSMDDMIVHKPDASKKATTSNGDTAFSKVQNPPRVTTEETGKQEKEENAQATENLTGVNAQMKQADKANDLNSISSTVGTDQALGQQETTADVNAADAHSKCPNHSPPSPNYNDTTYTEMKPVRKDPDPPLFSAVTTEPRNSSKPYTSGLSQTVLWTKERSECVNIEIQDEAKGNDGKRDSDEFSCGKVVNCIVGTFVCLFD